MVDPEYAKMEKTKAKVMEEYLKVCKEELGSLVDISIRS